LYSLTCNKFKYIYIYNKFSDLEEFKNIQNERGERFCYKTEIDAISNFVIILIPTLPSLINSTVLATFKDSNNNCC